MTDRYTPVQGGGGKEYQRVDSIGADLSYAPQLVNPPILYMRPLTEAAAPTTSYYQALPQQRRQRNHDTDLRRSKQNQIRKSRNWNTFLWIALAVAASVVNIAYSSGLVSRKWTAGVDPVIIESNNITNGSTEEGEQCLVRINGCDLSCLDWTIVLSLGRSGSTTIQGMISKLPKMNFFGEEGGIMDSLYQAQGTINETANYEKLYMAWYGSKDSDVTAMACMTQKLYAERHGQTCLHRGCRHGWKEIRYRKPEQIQWLRAVFPSSKLVLNYRRSCSGYKDTFGRDCTVLQKQKDLLLRSTEGLSNVFHMELEQLNNLTRWEHLAKFIGYDGCKAMNVSVYNLNRGTSRHTPARSPWSCL